MENVGLNGNSNVEQMLYNAILMTEMAMDIKENCNTADKHLSNLRNGILHAYKSLNSILRENENLLSLAHNVALSVAFLNEQCEYSKKHNNIKYETDKLLRILEKELANTEETGTTDLNSNEEHLKHISEKLKRLESRQRFRYLNASIRCSKGSDIDEKYPEKWLKSSFLDLDSAVKLPSVPECTSVDNGRVKKSSSVASFKKYRRIKLLLQRAESNSDEENDESGSEGQNSSHITLSDYEEKESDERNSSSTKTNTTLDDIEEEEENEI
ncbi:hypothetical protein CBL_00931 [Carabus blaptoides fortunei]